MDPLTALRDAIKTDAAITVDNDNLAEATALSVGSSSFPLSTKTRVVIDDAEQDLRAVYACWKLANENIAQYVVFCNSNGVVHFPFLQRSDVIKWLKGEADNVDVIKGGSDSSSAAGASATGAADASGAAGGAGSGAADADAMDVDEEEDPRLATILKNEVAPFNHNTMLRGVKPTDFASVQKECYTHILKSKGKATSAAEAPKGNGPDKRKEPIILLSPSASALLTLSNVREFLEQGSFVEPQSSYGIDMLRLNHTNPYMGKLTYVVVDSHEKLTKPEYWDRVVAVFTTGQEWQFKSYRWADPNQLFHRVKGFCLVFNGDPIPPAVPKWNVEVVTIDRTQRFKDREIVARFWESLDRFMINKGWRGRK